MNDEQFTLTVNGVEYQATWFPKEEDRRAAWYISSNGETLGHFDGYLGNRKQVENFIQFFLAGR